MEFLMRVKMNSMINLVSFFGYYITELLWYFLFEVVYCYFRRPREQQVGQGGAVMTNCVPNHHQSREVMVIGTKPVTQSINKEPYIQGSALNTCNSDDSDYDGDDESSESSDDDADNEVGMNSAKQKLDETKMNIAKPQQKLKHHGRSFDDASEEGFEMASEQWEVTIANPSKPKKTKPKKKKSKPKTNKRTKPSQMKEKKPKGNGAVTNQWMMGTVTDDTMKWDEGKMLNQQHHHPIKRPLNKQSGSTSDEGSSTPYTSCVQCCVQCCGTD